MNSWKININLSKSLVLYAILIHYIRGPFEEMGIGEIMNQLIIISETFIWKDTSKYYSSKRESLHRSYFPVLHISLQICILFNFRCNDSNGLYIFINMKTCYLKCYCSQFIFRYLSIKGLNHLGIFNYTQPLKLYR